ncbi:aspartyl-tRNA(Asn)/glutamyl-tRNA(Gln) amidotransferase subunit A [Leucobacter luti]|uniref:Aspartyl-tRNA(Asn)/glutamyl-tRNA(Gln) amidotransferase subunit A n=1 Tax=Leucobacter luti TaxID=340320 RepID=A0A4V6PVM4_9MICO|nr:amidase [Leucobacter luti]TDP90938.1 aspartyl-tRNA(Asn)/glutamyl-tRNA(Gln) amidotransferase subunit A [Leucobacter luti]
MTETSTCELTRLNTYAARALFRSGELAPSELLEATFARIAAVNGDRETGVNAFTEILASEAREQARAADTAWADARSDGSEPPPLLGIPVATKEKHGLAGRSLEQGLASQRGVLADADHPVVERVLHAGGIIHARTTSPEFSCATVTHSPAWGITRNPWHLAASPGGSSGGAGSALAAGMATLATASDIAGSTRIPAGFTGTVGYKAPYGRIPGLPPLSADWYRGDGPMARTVADTALFAGVLSGHHAVDHGSVGVPGAAPISSARLRAPNMRGRRIGLALTLGDYPVAPSIRANTERVAQVLEAAGAVIIPVELPWTVERITATTFAHFGYILGPAMAKLTAGTESELAAYTTQFIADAARAAADVSFPESLALDAAIQGELASAMTGLDALLTPVQAVEMLDAAGNYLDGIDAVGPDGLPVHLAHYWEAHMTSPFNVANRCPVLAVPSGISSVGVPTGVQIVGHPWDEATVFEIGAAIEARIEMPDYPDLRA